MNSFESDIKRAIFSIPFVAGVVIEIIILVTSGVNSDLFKVSLPVLATFPYSTAWLSDYESGYIKLYVSRTGINSYIIGKIISCGVSGGLLEVTGCYIYKLIMSAKEVEISFLLIFTTGALWAILAATMAAWSNSKYIAYGGAFVICYMLVILHDRYFKNLYCLYPYEWIRPTHLWVFEAQGIVIMLSGIMIIVASVYYVILRRRMEHV